MPNPVVSWRSQPLETKRRQLLISVGLATLWSLLLAIALGGQFVRLLVVMMLISGTYLSTAAAIGFAELRSAQQTQDRRQVRQRSKRPQRHRDNVSLPAIEADDLGLAELLSDGERPVLRVEPIDFDALFNESHGHRTAAELVEEALRQAALEEERNHREREAAAAAVARREAQEQEATEQAALAEAARGPTFTAAPEAGARQASARARRNKRRKARPIHIESSLDAPAPKRRTGND